MNSWGTASLDQIFSPHFCVSERQALQGLGTHCQMISQNYQYWHSSIPTEAVSRIRPVVILSGNKQNQTQK